MVILILVTLACSGTFLTGEPEVSTSPPQTPEPTTTIPQLEESPLPAITDSAGSIDITVPPPVGSPPVYVSIVTHNEQKTDYEHTPKRFLDERDALIEFANMLKANNVKFNYQSEWTFLSAVARFEGEFPNPDTNGKNVVRYIKEDLGFEVDPHAHASAANYAHKLHNYADVAYLIEKLGVTPSAVAGGMIVAPPEDSILEQFWQPITGVQYPHYTWTAEILWGGGTAYHENEESLWLSGIWKPKDKSHFAEHSADAPKLNVGHYGSSWETLDHLLQRGQNGELDASKIHTCAIFAGQSKLVRPDYIQEFEREIQSRTDQNIIWVGLAEVVKIWRTQYNSEPNLVLYLSP